VTDRRLLFLPNRLEQLVGAPPSIFARASVDHVVVIPPPPGWTRLAALPRAPKARAEIDVGHELLVLHLEDAEPLAQLLGRGR